MNTENSNPARRTALIWVFITLLAAFGIVAPFVFGMNGEDGGFALAFLCLILFITGIIVVVVYQRRATALDKMLRGDNVLARWSYSAEEWQQYAEDEHLRDVSGKRGLFIMIAVISLLVGIGFLIFDRKAGGWVFLATLGLVAFFGAVAWLSARSTYAHNKRFSTGAIIAPHGLYLNQQLHLWNQLGAKLDSVTYVQDKHHYIEFTYTAPTRVGLQQYGARVPVPQGREAEAKELTVKFNTGIMKA